MSNNNSTTNNNAKAADEEVTYTELDDLIKQLGPCSKVYWVLDQCLDRTDHSWSLCQAEVKRLKKCHDKHPGQAQAMAKQRAAFTKLQQINKELNSGNDGDSNKVSKADNNKQ